MDSHMRDDSVKDLAGLIMRQDLTSLVTRLVLETAALRLAYQRLQDRLDALEARE
jgi:hypothetical protein